jgi:hypothetical protein
MNIAELLETYDDKKHVLSAESETETKEIVKFITENIKHTYDTIKKITVDEKFKTFSNSFIESGQAKNTEQIINHLLSPKITSLNNKIKDDIIKIVTN